MEKRVIAIMYDFDKTLCTTNMQEYAFIPNLGMDVNSFWNEVVSIAKENKTDRILTYMYLMIEKMSLIGLPLTREYLVDTGKNMVLFPGVSEWFERINAYGEQLGMQVEHYVISSGIKEIIEGSKITKYFKEVYAGEFLYDEQGHAVWPKRLVNYTNKTQFLFRINKGLLDLADDNSLNKRMDHDERRIPTSNMIYIGDGITDVPCMKLTKDGGGISIAVYTDKSFKTAQSLLEDGRINYMTPANYEEGKELDQIMKQIISKMAFDAEFKNTSSQIKDLDEKIEKEENVKKRKKVLEKGRV